MINLKINLSLYFVISLISIFFTFFILNLIKKNNYVLTTLQVKNIKKINEFGEPNSCKIIINWQKQAINIEQAIKKIQSIKSIDQKLHINLNKYPLSWEKFNQIDINDFDNNCKWLIKPVVLEMETTTIWNHLIKQIINF